MGHRKTRRVYDEKLTYENLYAAWYTVLHTCNNRRGLYEFALHGQARVALILDELKSRRYWPNRYRCFLIFEPKARLVMSQSIRDKVVNHLVAQQYLLPLLERTLIDANVATRKKKGSKYAKKMIGKYIAELQAKKPGAPIYAMKIDVSKYFYTIDHEILFKMLRRRIKDPDVLEILRRIVSETNKPYINKVIDAFNGFYGTKIPHYERGKGLSIGAMTSQFLAIYYLSDIDRKVKEELLCKYFIRYMDDFLLLGHDKAELYRIRAEIEKELKKMKLKVNSKSALYNCCSKAGVPFLGYRYYVDKKGKLRIVPLAKTVRRIRKRLKILHEYDFEKYERSYESYRGYFMNAVPMKKMGKNGGA